MFTYSNGNWKVYRRFQGIFYGLGGELRGGGLRRLIFPWRNFSWGKRLSMKGAQDFLTLFKKKIMKKINIKSFFFY